MGKGDIKSRRGKFFAGSFGKRRPRKKGKKNQLDSKIVVINEELKTTSQPEIKKTAPKAEKAPAKAKAKPEAEKDTPVKKSGASSPKSKTQKEKAKDAE